jgi:hypothetical protein
VTDKLSTREVDVQAFLRDYLTLLLYLPTPEGSDDD